MLTSTDTHELHSSRCPRYRFRASERTDGVGLGRDDERRRRRGAVGGFGGVGCGGVVEGQLEERGGGYLCEQGISMEGG